MRIIPTDREKMIGHFAPGIDIPLHPFFGSMGVAPGMGMVDSAPPFAHAGNMVNKEPVAGTTLHIPVAAEGALFCGRRRACGPGQWRSGYDRDGNLPDRSFSLHRDQEQDAVVAARGEPIPLPLDGISPDLKEATEHALREMIDLLVEEKHSTRDDAYLLSSGAVDLDITPLVDGNVGVHAMCPKNIFADTAAQ